MGWREALEEQLWALCDGCRIEVRSSLFAMPTPDRIALARELLEGTGRVVARELEEVATVPYISGANSAYSYNAGYSDGHNACRAAMLAPDAGDG